ncbi:MAG: hypothetical protein ACK5N2_02935 [bacterium]
MARLYRSIAILDRFLVRGIFVKSEIYPLAQVVLFVKKTFSF